MEHLDPRDVRSGVALAHVGELLMEYFGESERFERRRTWCELCGPADLDHTSVELLSSHT
jgi:hypothetical protein